MKISVIVPAHNAEEYINRCVDSVINALEYAEYFDDSEIIIIDDGSTDNTSVCCERYLNIMPGFHMLQMEDKGVSAARNYGLSVASGEYISFIDADDILDKEFFKILMTTALHEKAEIVGCNFYMWSKESPFDESCKHIEHDVKRFSSKTFIEEEILSGNARCWSKLYRSELINELSEKPFDESLTIGEDMLFLLAMVKCASNIVEIKDYHGYGYYQNINGAINRPFTAKYMDQITCWEKFIEGVSDIDLSSNKKTKIQVNYVMAIMLVASKIALLSGADRKANTEYTDECSMKLKAIMNKYPQISKNLDIGYRIKTRIFLLSKKMYMMLYHAWK